MCKSIQRLLMGWSGLGFDMSEQEERLLSALASMAAQYLETEDGRLDHLFMSAGEEAIRVLAAYGLVIDNQRDSAWTDAGRAFLASH